MIRMGIPSIEEDWRTSGERTAICEPTGAFMTFRTPPNQSFRIDSSLRSNE